MLAMSMSGWSQSLPPDAVIVGNNIGFEQLTEAQVRRCLRGEVSRWTGGSDLSVTVVLPSTRLPECEATAQFLVSSPRPASLQKYWLGLVFEGRAKAPIFGQSQQDVLDAVLDKPGALGIVYGISVPEEYRIEVVRE
jgi:hypothetical protein